MDTPRAALDDDGLARELAGAAGELLLALRQQSQLMEPGILRAEGDRRSHEFLMEQLAALRPADAVLSEEGADDPARLQADRVWIVDPLDGTREFGEVPRVDWAVHVALWERGALSAGAVARPAMRSTLWTGRRPTVAAREPGPLRLAVSRSRPPEFVTRLAERLGAQLVPMGSAGIKACSVIDDVSDAYVHAGGQYEWDSAAPVAVARAAGLHTSRIDGSALVYNRHDPLLPDLLICRPEMADQILTALAEMADYEEAV
jgi:3'(2'), 5'-bisphosphate nucleotidase